jgi:hypothetical protein
MESVMNLSLHTASIRTWCRLTWLVGVIMLAAPAMAQTVWYVDGSTSVTQPPTGPLGWLNPYKFLGDVLSHTALANGDSVWIKGGPNASTPLVYYCDESAANPSGSDLATATFLVDEQIRLLGGFVGTELEEEERGDQPRLGAGTSPNRAEFACKAGDSV